MSFVLLGSIVSDTEHNIGYYLILSVCIVLKPKKKRKNGTDSFIRNY